MPRELEPWGGEVHMPHWLRHLLHLHDPPADTSERAREARQPPDDGKSVARNVERASIGVLGDLYHEGREAKGKGKGPKRPH